MKKKVILDIDTGEIIGELEKGDRILKGNSVDYLRDTVEFNDCRFSKVQEAFFEYRKELNDLEINVVVYLMGNTLYRSGMIAHKNGKPMTSENIANEYNYSVRNMQRILKSLCDKEIICREKVGKGYVYYMNPFICLKGGRVDAELVKKFEKSKFNENFNKGK